MPIITTPSGFRRSDVAQILMMATKGLKAATGTLGELRWLTNGLIRMAVETAESVQPFGSGSVDRPCT